MRIPLMLLVLVGACSGESDHATGGARSGLVPDTQTVANVLEMRHDAEAFARAPQWRVADEIAVVYDAGDRVDFDLTHVYDPVLLDDGHLVGIQSMNGARLMLFAPTGTPSRMLATSGEGPGELRRPSSPLRLGDSIAVLDGATARVNWFTVPDGFVGSEPMSAGANASCPGPTDILPDRRIVAVNRCHSAAAALPPEGGRMPTLVATIPLHYSRVDTVAVVPGMEMRMVETRFRGQRLDHRRVVRLSPVPDAVAWGTDVAMTSSGDGYIVERRGPDGTLRSRLHVAVPRRAVTDAMRDRVIERALALLESLGSEGMVDPEESRRLAREEPIADSLPYLGWLKTDGEGVLWVGDVQAPTDSVWHATGFRQDGSIMGRLTGTAAEYPTQILRDRVLLRTVDDDGVVRFVIRRIVKPASP